MENFNPADVAQKIMDAIQKEYKELKKLNVMILGKTGVGKSTLINNMFSQKVADTGVGKPVTHQIRKIEKPDFPLAIYDTPGLELGGENAIDSLLQEVIGKIQAEIKSGDISKAIHCIWYCISTPSHRFEQAEIDFLKRFLEETETFNVPVIVVLTQSYSKNDAKELKSEIEKENLSIVNVVPVLSEDYDIDEDYTAKAYGLDKLSEIMNSVIPEAVQKTFVAVQCANLDLKKGKAQAVVVASAVAAAVTGAVPIPFSDAALLIPEQITMLGSITAVFGVPMEKATLVAIVSGTMGTAGTTVLGKAVVSGLLKLIPGAGSAVGGAISAATAATLTSALGEAYIIILIKVCKGEMSLADLGTNRGKQEITKIFKEQLKVKRDKNGVPVE
ncbi:DUF697 domain-containing protein [Clostridium cochlearium]|uniref:GTPase n=1 Tax=Clostridium cochlearium TaxID=1494 RepID=UPI00145995FD|nr:GTPase [Clostridium cochlearium]MBV1819901.1 GTP-binding DUF697 domain-containing protein [Bacteroidales bacterium MSK.15.36]MCG4580764.1 GTP-binding DUF697 domain-containing protein [Clostridium cochlearium]NME94474.1 DUF697 domain-containing protein [Clostridium cochlearium]NSJ91656.1 DUF697 domain-containing protein [Coprococcus sp. MSK.21.13]